MRCIHIALITLLFFLVVSDCQPQYGPITTLAPALRQNENQGRCVIASGQNVHVVWYAGNSTESGIYYMRSDDQGQTWNTANRLSPSPGTDTDPLIAISGDIIHLVFFRGASLSMYKRSLDNGNTWGQGKVDIDLINCASCSINKLVDQLSQLTSF